LNAGDVLASTGDDGITRIWRKALTGKWLEACEVEIEDDEQ